MDDFDISMDQLVKKYLETEEKIFNQEHAILLLKKDMLLAEGHKNELEKNKSDINKKMLALMQDCGIIETQSGSYRVFRKKCKRTVFIENEELLPNDYIITKIEKRPNKISLGKILHSGVEIPGAKLTDESYTIEIKATYVINK